MSSFSFPENYGLVFGGLFATAAANLYCAINVSIHRKKFGIKCACAARCHRSAKCSKCVAMTKSAMTCESWGIRCSCHGATTAAPRQGESRHHWSRLRII